VAIAAALGRPGGAPGDDPPQPVDVTAGKTDKADENQNRKLSQGRMTSFEGNWY